MTLRRLLRQVIVLRQEVGVHLLSCLELIVQYLKVSLLLVLRRLDEASDLAELLLRRTHHTPDSQNRLILHLAEDDLTAVHQAEHEPVILADLAVLLVRLLNDLTF